ncbi:MULTISPECIES: amino acid adenylation domain-containing protein [unclassified Crossiella]|uniref:amino acid adenylation domain-containing protein n=1 Tax=unclassified Crossiella TaxID=2620835 RepID=UPI001FFF97CE|nr:MULTISPECIES: amino acid adenylation domain-containing protein [unclassified Crossiella]MCK2244132.1 amino acid adenylation domain-containing protein [Crossiella sp. S99.2]MCK2257936.1 amino acid adenylation domain-containing protein [Crossiella sp. S99.1]
MTTRPVLTMLAERVAAAPEAAAIRDGGAEVSYHELWQRSGRIVAMLAAAGAGLGVPVGLHARRGADLVVAIIALLRAGSVCVPLDLSYPVDRLHFMRADAELELVLGHAGEFDRLGELTTVAVEGTLALGAWPDRPARPAQSIVEPGPADLAYLTYTSGSTGRPKGVRYEHGGLDNVITWQVADSVCGPGARTLQFAPVSFDISYLEVLATLCAGGTLVCCADEVRYDPELLWELIAAEQVNRLFIPFVTLQALATYAEGVGPETHPLREVFAGGEQLQINEHIRSLFRTLPDCSLLNHWGTVEVFISTTHRLPPEVERWPVLPPIGRELANTTVHVCDPDGRVLPDGEIGELVVSGDSVGPGFWKLPEATAERYRPDPLDPSVRAYRTGDLGLRNADGLLECLGRLDSQVKVRGFRVELGEIEAALAAMPGLADCAVLAAGTAEDRHLVAVLILAGEAEPGHDEVLAWLTPRLPAYMLPTRTERTGAFPLTPSGKVDRRALAQRHNHQPTFGATP